ncbi:DDE-type integrase/transposase/recombinase [Actinomyces bowdenii]|uniref:Integrase catalytic domain-containing protein n=1 Tax=Actinomyces bowdenii TaxID=131109 RepID=A0A3P1V1Y1_9ACTO|nr:DDE-type integrase/transposase/recombinase [Actinomyces bowdenii]RRD27305.1 hypothetical protein EII10_09705 [Actinomyces bowdenii]
MPRCPRTCWAGTHAPAGPDQRWAADFTYVHTWSGFCYTAFVMDLLSRRIVGWSTSTTTGH